MKRRSVQSQAKSGPPTRRIPVAFGRKSQFPSNTARVIHNECMYAMRKAGVFSILFVVVLLAGAVIAEAQQAGKIFRIGFLDNSSASGSAVFLEAFRQELTKLGWIERKNITIEYRFAEQKLERLPELAADLVRLRVDLIVASGGPTPLAAKEATGTIPIVMTSSVDPVGAGLVASLARPGGNVTGNSSLSNELITKRQRYSMTLSQDSHESGFCGAE